MELGVSCVTALALGDSSTRIELDRKRIVRTAPPFRMPLAGGGDDEETLAEVPLAL
jgi:hypothetical protein